MMLRLWLSLPVECTKLLVLRYSWLPYITLNLNGFPLGNDMGHSITKTAVTTAI